MKYSEEVKALSDKLRLIFNKYDNAKTVAPRYSYQESWPDHMDESMTRPDRGIAYGVGGRLPSFYFTPMDDAGKFSFKNIDDFPECSLRDKFAYVLAKSDVIDVFQEWYDLNERHVNGANVAHAMAWADRNQKHMTELKKIRDDFVHSDSIFSASDAKTSCMVAAIIYGLQGAINWEFNDAGGTRILTVKRDAQAPNGDIPITNFIDKDGRPISLQEVGRLPHRIRSFIKRMLQAEEKYTSVPFSHDELISVSGEDKVAGGVSSDSDMPTTRSSETDRRLLSTQNVHDNIPSFATQLSNDCGGSPVTQHCKDRDVGGGVPWYKEIYEFFARVFKKIFCSCWYSKPDQQDVNFVQKSAQDPLVGSVPSCSTEVNAGMTDVSIEPHAKDTKALS